MKTTKDNQTMFCILTTQKSGSTWLEHLIDSHPEIKVFGEAFLWNEKNYNWQYKQEKILPTYFDYKNKYNSEIRPWIIFKYLDILKNYPEDYRAIGFRLMYNQLLFRPEIFGKLLLDNYKIIHLVRQNILDIILSGMVAPKEGFSYQKIDKKYNQVTLEISSLMKEFVRIERKQKLAKNILNILPLPFLEITYEDLCINTNATLKPIAEFLNVKSSNIIYKSELKKINQGSYTQKIANYEEVKNALAGTRFEKFLNEYK